MSPDWVLTVPAAFWIPVSVAVTVAGALVFYALHRKGDVTAEFSHGLTSFRLEARDRGTPGTGTRSKSKNALPRP